MAIDGIATTSIRGLGATDGSAVIGLVAAVVLGAELCAGFGGRVVRVVDPGHVLAVAVGDAVAGSVSYPADLADAQADPSYGVYLARVPPAELAATVGRYRVRAAVEISISAIDSPVMGDQIQVGGAWAVGDLPGYVTELSLRYRDTSGASIVSDALPRLTDPWPVRRLVVQGCLSGDACTRPTWEVWAEIEETWPCARGFAGGRARSRR